MADQPALAELQRWMVASLCRPDEEDAARFDVDEVVAASSTITAGQRMNLYRQGYQRRLLECLRAMHPALRQALGYQVFDAFALDYLETRPSRSYTLSRLGEAFSQHLEDTRPDAAPWTDFVIDVVRFEQAFLDVYDGEGPEGRAPVRANDLPVDCAGWVVRGVPGLRLFHSPYPVGEYVLAVRRSEHPDLPTPRATWAALARRDYVVTMVPLDADSFAMVRSLLGGVPVGPGDEVRARLGEWADRGLIGALFPKEST